MSLLDPHQPPPSAAPGPAQSHEFERELDLDAAARTTPSPATPEQQRVAGGALLTADAIVAGYFPG